MSVSSFFPYDAVGRAILNDFLYLFFRILREFNHLDIARIVSSEDGGAQLQTRLTINAFTQINDWNLHYLSDSSIGKGLGYLLAKLMARVDALIIRDIFYLHPRID